MILPHAGDIAILKGGTLAGYVCRIDSVNFDTVGLVPYSEPDAVPLDYPLDAISLAPKIGEFARVLQGNLQGQEVVIVGLDNELGSADCALRSGSSGIYTKTWETLEILEQSTMEAAGLDLSDPNVKDSNPKDAIGCTKPSTHFIPKPVLYEVGNALFEGARKYGAYNWRVAGVRASVYQNAAGRHIDSWQEGEDIDPASGIHHLSKAIAGLMVIRDAMICDKFVDDRPPSAPKGWMDEAQKQTDAIIERHPVAVQPYTQENYK